MIRLPHSIGVGRLSPIEQIKLFTVGSRSLVRHGQQRGIKVLDDLTDPPITGGFHPCSWAMLTTWR